MTKFLDGPAAGVTLMLKRAPHYLRVVQAPDGKFDALDQLTDLPRSDERIVVYEMVGEPSWMHIRSRRGGGIFRGGEYRVVDPQPDDSEIRLTTRWREWVSSKIGQPVADDGTAATT